MEFFCKSDSVPTTSTSNNSADVYASHVAAAAAAAWHNVAFSIQPLHE